MTNQNGQKLSSKEIKDAVKELENNKVEPVIIDGEPHYVRELSKAEWQDINKWEVKWWGDCTNTFIEESKHLKVMQRMGLEAKVEDAHLWHDLQGKSVLDIGGGVVSILLKCKNKGMCGVIDPILAEAPEWVHQRYRAAGIEVYTGMAEELVDLEESAVAHSMNEIWMYNVLQHVQDPIKILEGIKLIASLSKNGVTLRIHEWLNTPAHDGHPHTITKEMIDEILGIDLKVIHATPQEGFKYAGIGVYQL